jgi:STE24 endopeptidase
LELQLLAILIVYLTVEAAEQFLLMLNLRHLSRYGTEVPPPFQAHIDAATLMRMRDYTVAHGRLDRIETVISTGITLLFLFGGLLNWLNNLIASTGWPPVISGVVFFLILIYAGTLIKIPFSLYNTFSLEKRFGFSNETLSLWVQDFLKSLLINSLLSVFLLYGILWLIMTLPDMWWLAGWAFVLLFTIFLLYISPYVIEPLFNTFSPIENEALEKRIKKTMSTIGLKINRVFTMDASKRTSHSNAYFTGIGHVKRIVLFDTLLSNHADDEIITILAHEAGHWKKKHVLKMLVFSQVVALIGFYAAYRLTAGDFLAELFRLDIPSLHAKLLLVTFIGSLILFPLKPLMAYISRQHEIEADNFALQLTQTPVPLANGLIKLGKDNLANLNPHPWYVAVYYSHPPLVQRVGRILNVKGNRLHESGAIEV